MNTFAAFKMEKVLEGQGIIWGMEFIDSTILFTQRSGEIKSFDLKTKKVVEIKGAPKVYARGQGGLLDIKKHPDFAKNKRIYLTYSKSVGGNKTTALGYGILEGNELKDFKDIFIAKENAEKRIHFGSRIAFTEENKIFVSVGDRGNRDNPQDLSNHFGKVMRINDDGSVPKDNPFVGKEGVRAEIWSYGHRNPQGLFYDKESKTLYEMEHGPRGGDEINIIKKGANYGWPVISYGREYVLPVAVGEGTEKKGMEQPIKYYVPSIAPCGLIYYNNDKFPELKGSLISGALALTHVNVYNLKTKKDERLFDSEDIRFRSIASNAEGEVFMSTDGGKIYKLSK